MNKSYEEVFKNPVIVVIFLLSKNHEEDQFNTNLGKMWFVTPMALIFLLHFFYNKMLYQNR